MWYILLCGSGWKVLLITNKVFQLQPSFVLLLLFMRQNQTDYYYYFTEGKSVTSRTASAINDREDSQLSANPVQIIEISTQELNYHHTCKKLCKTLFFILRFLAALVVQRRFRISPRMIFTGVKATIPHDCKPSLLEQTPAPIFLCVKTFPGKIKITLSAAVQ